MDRSVHTDRVPVPPDIAPDDSFVLDVDDNGSGVTLVVEAALRSEHPRFYWPPREGEANAYARLVIRLRGDVEWLDGPRLKVSSEATGERDYGDLGGWWTDDPGNEHLDGEWGRIVVRSPQQSVEVLPAMGHTVLYCPCLLDQSEEGIIYEGGAFREEALAQSVIDRWKGEGRTEPMSVNIIPLYESLEAWEAGR
jgi:hypothetical protein